MLPPATSIERGDGTQDRPACVGVDHLVHGRLLRVHLLHDRLLQAYALLRPASLLTSLPKRSARATDAFALPFDPRPQGSDFQVFAVAFTRIHQGYHLEVPHLLLRFWAPGIVSGAPC